RLRRRGIRADLLEHRRPQCGFGAAHRWRGARGRRCSVPGGARATIPPSRWGTKLMAANLTRYSYWQFRDFIRERGLALIITSTLLGFTVVAPMRAMLGSHIDEVNAKRILMMALPQLVYISAFIALNGLISTDRKLGYYRFLFSKPVSIPAYYAQYFL